MAGLFHGGTTYQRGDRSDKRLTAIVPPETADALARAVAATGDPASRIMREAIEAHLTRGGYMAAAPTRNRRSR